MKKVMVFPFIYENELECMGVYLNHEYEIESLVSYPGWDNGKEYCIHGKHYCVSFDFFENLERCDILWLCDNDIVIDTNDLLSYIQAAVDKNKTVWIGRSINELALKNLMALDPFGTHIIFPKKYLLDCGHTYQSLSTPVLAVGGFCQNMGKFGFQIAITREFMLRGYHPLLVSSRPDAEFFGHYSIPDWRNVCASDNDKIMALNYYFSKLEHYYHPDLFVIGIPGAMLPNDLDYFFDFATTAFQISQAIAIDDAVMILPCLDFESNAICEFTAQSEAKLGTPISYFSIDRKTIDFANTKEKGHPDFVAVSNNYLLHAINNCKLSNVSSIYTDSGFVSSIVSSFIGNYS